jgi:hypothetical protein
MRVGLFLGMLAIGCAAVQGLGAYTLSEAITL